MIQRRVVPEELFYSGYKYTNVDMPDLLESASMEGLWEDCQPGLTIEEYRVKWPNETYREVLLP